MDVAPEDSLEYRIAARVDVAAAATGSPSNIAEILKSAITREGIRNLTKGELVTLAREILQIKVEPDVT